MSNAEIIRSWKDATYRASLTAEQRAQLLAHPAGVIELSDADLEQVSGGRGPTGSRT